ncbi:MBL fold metallo-hydrolase [Halopseudomonas xiamenensis]|uniref:MBL fold metallo-hydrolase n=1 Tax=Halopseudomonas xiamenensis TaxID=157792 RepID=UPI001627598B|nr:MBL fold metallo-hydrolase [Halopseudomonas xiamenensis]
MSSRFLFRRSLLAAGLAAVVAASTSLAEPIAKQPHQVPGYYRMNIGELEVTALYDGYVHFDPAWLKGISKDNLQNLLNEMFINTEEGIQTAVNGYLINTGSHLILVDAGAAECFGPTMGSLANNLRASGYKPEQIDTVLLTHLHPDHSCGVANADGTPAFPNAIIYVPQAEAEFWLDTAMGDIAETDQAFFDMTRTAMAPYTEEKLQRYQPDDTLLPGVKSVPAYGHTPGHTAYLFSSGTERLMVWGDIVHNHAVQFAHPDVVIEADVDTDQARASRLQLLSRSSAQKFWIAGAHLPFPGLGHVRVKSDAYAWVPAEFSPIVDSLESAE